MELSNHSDNNHEILLNERFISDISNIKHIFDLKLAKFTTFNIGGPAQIALFPNDENQLISIVTSSKVNNIPITIIGGGSNILISDLGIKGAVVFLRNFKKITIDKENNTINVGSGASFPMLTKTALNEGWKNALGWVGIPGQVGGALVMNAGTRYGEIGDNVVYVDAIDPKNCNRVRLYKKELQFDYRNCERLKNLIICSAQLKCEASDIANKHELLGQARIIKEQTRNSQPKKRCAGCIFKNPQGDYAGRLIDMAGLKGRKIGGAQISEHHANFIVNNGQACAKDVMQLANLAQEKVYDLFSIQLQFEVKIIG